MTRDEAIRWFTDTRAGGLAFGDKQVAEASDMAITALQEQEKFRWIPVTERLPEDNIPSTAYLCWWRGHTHICKYWRTRKCFEFNGRVVNVTHWMPLPEPPGEDV